MGKKRILELRVILQSIREIIEDKLQSRWRQGAQHLLFVIIRYVAEISRCFYHARRKPRCGSFL